jgi:DNA-binding MarR family transcriptional regulator
MMPKRQHAVKRDAERTRTPAGDAWSGLVVRVLRLAGLLTEAGDALAAPSGQSSARWRVLAAADHSPATVAQIARALGLARQSIQRVADVLTSEGLTAYADNPDHLRAKLLRLTAKGHSVLAAIQKAQRSWADELGNSVGEAALVRANEGLEKALAALLSREGGGDPGAKRNG